MKKQITTILAGVMMIIGLVQMASGHCQIPCGIFDDEARFASILEHVTTIEKSMKQVEALSKEAGSNNQLVRWVTNKEKHADELAEIITYYFMAQRVKSTQPHYEKKLTLLHQMLVHSMKAKQTTAVAHCEALRKLTAEFKAVYMAK